jgi:hypothetical protein
MNKDWDELVAAAEAAVHGSTQPPPEAGVSAALAWRRRAVAAVDELRATHRALKAGSASGPRSAEERHDRLSSLERAARSRGDAAVAAAGAHARAQLSGLGCAAAPEAALSSSSSGALAEARGATAALREARERLAAEVERSAATHGVLAGSSDVLDDTRSRHAELGGSLARGHALLSQIDRKEVREFRIFAAAAVIFAAVCVYITLDRIFGWTPLALLL